MIEEDKEKEEGKTTDANFFLINVLEQTFLKNLSQKQPSILDFFSQ